MGWKKFLGRQLASDRVHLNLAVPLQDGDQFRPNGREAFAADAVGGPSKRHQGALHRSRVLERDAAAPCAVARYHCAQRSESQSLNRYSYGLNNPVKFADPTGHWPGWYDVIRGATYQYVNDTPLGLAGTGYEAIYGMSVDLAFDENDAFQQGQEYGRAASETVATAEIVGGLVVATTGAVAGPPTAAVAAGAAIPSGGISLIGGTVVLTAEGAMVVGGVAVSVYGSSVLAYTKANPLGRNDPSYTNPVEAALSKLAKGRNSGVRTVESADDLNDLFAELTKDGTPIEGSSYRGAFVELPDGTRIGLRNDSKSGGPAMDIFYPDGRSQKVHVR